MSPLELACRATYLTYGGWSEGTYALSNNPMNLLLYVVGHSQ